MAARRLRTMRVRPDRLGNPLRRERNSGYSAAAGKGRAHFHRAALADVNAVFAALKAGHVDGRVVLDMATATGAATVVGAAA